MGWDFQHVEKGTSTIDVLRSDLNGEHRIVAHAVKNGAAYLAVCHKDDPDHVEACVVLIQRRSRDYHNFGAKWMSEDMGPCKAECPDRILDLLSPATSEFAAEWREKCRTYNARRKAQPKVTPGTVIEFAQPIEFTNGDTYSRFVYLGGCKFTSTDPWARRYHITRWRDRAFELVAS